MKKLLKNKNFLPNKYVEEKIKKENKKNSRACKILGLAMIFLVPFTTTSILKKPEKPQAIEKTKSINQSEIIKLLDFCGENVQIRYNKAELEIDIANESKLIELCSSNKILISKVENLGKENYKIKGTIK